MMGYPRLCGTFEHPRVVDHTNGTCIELYQYQASLFQHHEVNYGPGPHSLDDVHIDITSRCNMSCPHCYQSCSIKTGQNINTALAESVIKQSKELGGCRIALSGGEALLHPDFNEIVSYIDEYKMLFTALFTNGLVMDERVITLTKPWTMILVSYSPALNQVCDVGYLKEIAKKRNLTISTITKTGEELDELYSLMEEIKPYRWRVGICRPVGRGINIGINIESSVAAYHKLFDRFIKQWEAKIPKFELQLGFAFQTAFLKKKRIDLYPEDAKCCAYKAGSLTVKWDGKVTPCSMDENPIGSADDLADAWRNIENRSYRGLPSSDIETCRNCALRKWCNGGCRLCATDKSGPDPIGCATYRFLEEISPRLRQLGVKIGGE